MTSPSSRIAIGAAFARTSVGLTWESTCAAVRAGITRLQGHPYMVDRNGEPYVVATVPDLEATAGRERCLELLKKLSADAVQTVAGVRGTVAVWVCLPETFAGVDANLVRASVDEAIRKRPVDIHLVTQGHASGLIALQRARMQIESGTIDAALLLGADSHIDPDRLDALDESGELMSTSNKFGFPPGEAASGLLIAADSTLRNARLPVLVRIVDVGLGSEPEPMGSEGVSTGQGLATAINGATQRFSAEHMVGRIYSDQNGQRYRDSDYVWATQRVRPVFEEFSDFVTPSEAWGDVGAATGLLLVGLSAALGRHLRQQSRATLVYTSSTGRERAAVTLHHESIR